MSEKAERIAPYTALVVQPEVTVIKKREDIMKNLDRVCNLIHFGVDISGNNRFAWCVA